MIQANVNPQNHIKMKFRFFCLMPKHVQIENHQFHK
jgi:hypothetical protein